MVGMRSESGLAFMLTLNPGAGSSPLEGTVGITLGAGPPPEGAGDAAVCLSGVGGNPLIPYGVLSNLKSQLFHHVPPMVQNIEDWSASIEQQKYYAPRSSVFRF